MAGGALVAVIARPESTADATAVRVSAATLGEETFWSPSLGRQMAYVVYLPPGYATSPNHRYPVLYMLHGLGGNQESWRSDGLFSTAVGLMQQGAIAPFIIVAPQGESGYWMDHSDNGPRFGTYVAKDLVGQIDAKYRTIPQREERAIGGMSMGAHGAFQLALNHPDEFAVVGAHSVALRRKEQAFAFFGDEQYFKAHDPVSLAKKKPADAQRLTIWMDIGKDDPWYQAASAYDQQLQTENVAHAWHVYDGGHDDSYWAAHAGDYLRFYSQALSARLVGPVPQN